MSGLWPRRARARRGVPRLGCVQFRYADVQVIQDAETLTISWDNGAKLVLPMSKCVGAEVLHTEEPKTVQFSGRFSLPRSDRRVDVITFRLCLPSLYEQFAHEIAWRLRERGTSWSSRELHVAGRRLTSTRPQAPPLFPPCDQEFRGSVTEEAGHAMRQDVDPVEVRRHPPGVRPVTDDWITFGTGADSAELVGRLAAWTANTPGGRFDR